MTQTLTIPEALANLTPDQLAQLPASQLAEVYIDFDQIWTQVKKYHANFDAALELRYREQAIEALQKTSRDFGTAQMEDGRLRVSYLRKRNTSWNQKILTEVAEQLTASGRRVEDFIKIELSVLESKLDTIPSEFTEQVKKAKTDKVGKPAILLSFEKKEESEW